MNHPHHFDDFYKDARGRLLLQTYALTGDLPASRRAVRDAFVGAWHHWRKVSRLEDPEAWTRPQAWAHAQRRHTARAWHRDKSLPPEAKATLDALGRLTLNQRKVLLLTQLATTSLHDVAREVGLPQSVAERELQTASAQFSLHRDVPSSSIRAALLPLQERVDDARWARPTIIRRAGATRRRTHTMVGVTAVVAALLVSGSLVNQGDGIRPSLAGENVTSDVEPETGSAEEPEATETTETTEPRLVPDELLTRAQVERLAPKRDWKKPSTDDNTAGDGIVLPCQRERFADPRGDAALVRTFDSVADGQEADLTATQFSELSDTRRAARGAYRTTVEWYAGCSDDRAQLLSTHRVPQLGEEATVLVLRSWERPVTTYTVGIARTGRVTTSTVTSVEGVAEPDVATSASLLAASVNALCGAPGTASCAAPPEPARSAPLPVGEVPSMLDEVDLPPVSTVEKPWVGTEARQAKVNVASTSCDRASFDLKSMSNNMTRTFLIPQASLPAEFGLTETVAGLPTRGAAQGFVQEIRDRMNGCEEKDLGTEVQQFADRSSPEEDLSVWEVTTEVSDQVSVRYLMGIVRRGNAVGQVSFVPADQVDMTSADFQGLVDRAVDRLAELPSEGQKKDKSKKKG